MSREESPVVRAFFAVDLDEAARRGAASIARELRGRPGAEGVRWVRPETLHVTLRFLGQVALAGLPALVERVGTEVAGLVPFSLSLTGPRLFPLAKRPRAVALGVEPEEPLAELAAAVERGVRHAGLGADERPFRAHLTLGRVRERGGTAPRLDGVPAPPESSFRVREAVLFRSELRRDGAHYTPLETLALRGSHHPI